MTIAEYSEELANGKELYLRKNKQYMSEIDEHWKKGSMNVDTALAIVCSKVLGFDQSCLGSGKKKSSCLPVSGNGSLNLEYIKNGSEKYGIIPV